LLLGFAGLPAVLWAALADLGVVVASALTGFFFADPLAAITWLVAATGSCGCDKVLIACEADAGRTAV
jgi:hypothetical protein